MNLPLRKKLVFTALLAATAVVALFLVGELFLRGWLAHRDSLLIVPDDKLGWRAKENVAWTREKHDAAGVTYAVRYRTDARGSRLYGDAATAKTKVLLVSATPLRMRPKCPTTRPTTTCFETGQATGRRCSPTERLATAPCRKRW
ncbi:MAG: hypothetical protein P9L99_02465 [Candidatus Lernaella stagnicola]|nr:hypothetical protein [Candidatus Lernaella stagnicola]